jgi:hypothetical protein
VELHGSPGRVRSSASVLSDDAGEWLNDAQLANAAALLPTCAQLRIAYPRSQAQMLSWLGGGSAGRLLRSEPCDDAADVMAQLFCGQMHWHFFALCGSERRAYYFEGRGGQLGTRNQLRIAVEEHGWALECLTFRLQTDYWNCGLWAHVVLKLLVEYVLSGNVGTATFSQLLSNHPQFSSLFSLKGAALTAATERNVTFIEQERDETREVSLIHAAAFSACGF